MEPSILEEYYIKGIAFILRNLTDSEDEMFSIINTGNYSAEKYRKKYRKNHKKYINYINEIFEEENNNLKKLQLEKIKIKKQIKNLKEFKYEYEEAKKIIAKNKDTLSRNTV